MIRALGVLWASAILALAQSNAAPRVPLDDLSQWKGREPRASASGTSMSFQYPEGGRSKHGFRFLHSGTRDWRGYEGLEFLVKVEEGREAELELVVLAPAGMAADERTTGKVRLSGSGHRFVSWDALDFERARSSWKKFVRGFEVTLRYTDGKPGSFGLESAALLKASAVSLTAEVKGKSVPSGGVAEYEIEVGNPLAHEQSIVIKPETYGWQSMKVTVEPSAMRLAAGATTRCKVTVKVPDHLPPGAHETQVLVAFAEGSGGQSQRLELITGAEVPPPYILHTPKRWQEVRDKVEKHDWAKTARDRYVKQAREWKVPEPALKDPGDTWGPYLFQTKVESDLMACGIAWQLTGDRQYAVKVAEFLKRLCHPETGYLKTLRACNQSQVQEGHFFQHIAMSYDMVKDAGVIDESLRREVELTFRAYFATFERLNDSGSINNWNVSEVCGAFYCALAIQDLAEARRWFQGPNGICDQLRLGTMDDGWWYECSISYNTWVASEFTQVALAFEPFGVNFRDMWLPASNVPNVLLRSELNGGGDFHPSDPEQIEKPFGMDPSIFGPSTKPYRRIRDLWDSLVPFLDWRGVMFGVNDSTERRVVAGPNGSGREFEIAYYVFRDPAFASIIRRGAERDLLYGVPELPEKTPEPYRDSAAADNVGLVMLRSQTPQRPIREQIQAVIHYGTHGWAHGHFDRTSLLSLMRYGRSFYNPEAVWHSYEPFMYKFYVQTSVSKNMVVVDRKMQKATPGERVLFHQGTLMQATAVETVAPWGHPPYGGMVYDYVPVKSFAEKTWREGRHVPIPEDAPNYGEITGYSEPIHQRRSMVVTDDYVLLIDSLKGEREHEFESLFQTKGFKGLDAPEKRHLRHDAQWDSNPLGAAQFVTDCDWYEVKAPAVSRFEMHFGPDADNAGTRAPESEPGVLKLDVHTLWPPRQEVMFGTAPEDHGLGQRLFYQISGDGKRLVEGKFGAWTLGKDDVDVSVAGVKQLVLETRVELKKRPTLFWGSARVLMQDGSEVPLSELSPQLVNVKSTASANQDYSGGPVKIQGEPHPFSTPAQPADDAQPARVIVDLSDKQAFRFKASIGSDFPPGPEAARRKTMSVKASTGNSARFLTIIEPYEAQRMIVSAEARSDSEVRVILSDGREQTIQINDQQKPPVIEIIERANGRETRRETTK